MRIVKNIFCACLACVTLLSLLPLSALDASAVTPTYYVSSEYRSTKYYDALKNCKLTGDERYDVISIAMSQYGYHEGNSDADMHGGNLDGDKNFAEYNRMYGMLDNGEGNGLSYGYSWCAAFVSWCLRQARVPTSTVETFVSCSRAVRSFRSKGLFKEADSGYIPRTGDIIFFVKPEEAAAGYIASHVGFVVGTDGENVYTIEGNTDYCNVCQKKYPLDSEKLVGYAVPDYKTVEGTVYDFELRDDARYPGSFTVVKDGIEVCREACNREEQIGSLGAGERVEVSEIVLGWGLIDFGGTQGWIPLIHAEAQDTFTVALASEGAEPALLELRKEKGVDLILSPLIPKREGFTFVGWEKEEGGGVAYLPSSLYTADESLTLRAVWTANRYNVMFVDFDGRVIASESYTHGDPLRLPEPPVRESDGVNLYEFSGWDVPIPETVTSAVVYRATYRSTPIQVTTEEATTEAPVVTAPPPETDEVTSPDTSEADVTEDITAEVTAAETTDCETERPPESSPTEPDLIIDAGCFASASMPIFTAAMIASTLCLLKKRR